MNILYINTNFTGGGAEKISRVLYEGLKDYGNNTYYLEGQHAKSSNVPYIYPDRGPVVLFNLGIKVLTNNARRHDYWARHVIKKFIIQNKIDIVHFHNIHGNYIGYSDLTFLSKFCKVVWTLHDMWAITAHCAYSLGCEKWKNGCVHCPNRRVYKRIYWGKTSRLYIAKMRNYSSNLTLVSPSEWLLNMVRQSPLSENKCLLINNGVDLNIYRYKEKHSSNRKISILFGSNSNRSVFKNIKMLVTALNEIEDKTQYILHIYGGSIDSNISHEYEIIDHGYIKSEYEMANLYAECDVFILPSAAENYSCAILESLACGTPVIASNVGGNTELVNINNGWIFSINSSSDLKRVIESVTKQDVQEKNRYLKEIYSRYDQKNMFEQYEKLYLDLLDRN